MFIADSTWFKKAKIHGWTSKASCELAFGEWQKDEREEEGKLFILFILNILVLLFWYCSEMI